MAKDEMCDPAINAGQAATEAQAGRHAGNQPIKFTK